MDGAESTTCVCFPPLTSVIGLDKPPPEAMTLLTDRWMARSTPSIGADPTFRLRWALSATASGIIREEPGRIRWEPTGESGTLHNAGGRIAVSPDVDEALVRLDPLALDRPGWLEPLVEAALGHALTANGECFLHAAAVELHGRTPLLIGDAGSGKSTLAAAVVAHGGRAISDDSLLLGLVEGRPLVRAARRNVWLRPGSEALLPALEARDFAIARAADGRIRLDRARSPDAFRDSTPPDCLVLLSRARHGDGVDSRRLTQARALAALLQGTSALYVTDVRFAHRQRLLLDLLTRFAEALPAIELEVGASLLESTEECLAAIWRSLP